MKVMANEPPHVNASCFLTETKALITQRLSELFILLLSEGVTMKKKPFLHCVISAVPLF